MLNMRLNETDTALMVVASLGQVEEEEEEEEDFESAFKKQYKTQVRV